MNQLPPTKAPAATALHPVLDNAPPIECCGTCRFWNRDRGQDMPQGRVAPCRRYPITAVLVTTMQRTLRGDQMAQGPGTVPTITGALDWCGEYSLETRASAYSAEDRKGGSA